MQVAQGYRLRAVESCILHDEGVTRAVQHFVQMGTRVIVVTRRENRITAGRLDAEKDAVNDLAERI